MKAIKFWVLYGLFLLFLCSCQASDGNSKTTTFAGGSPSHGGSTGGGTGGDGGTDGGTIDGGGGGTGGDGGTIAQFRPALAVRAMGCIMCHGKVEANIITDFGYGGDGHGNDYFFGKNAPGTSEFNGAIYGDHSINWSSSKVWGTIYVPSMPFQSFLNGNLGSYLRQVTQAPDAVTPKPTVTENSIVYIGAPTESRIRSLAAGFPLSHPKWKYRPSPNGDLAGVELSPTGNYVRNILGQSVPCRGDLIVDGTLLLNNLILDTDNQGCRIYVTQSVFIQGPITFLGTSSQRNLQITSARSVSMGVGPGPVQDASGNTVSNDSLRFRFQGIWTRPGYFTRDNSLTNQAKLDQIVDEESNISELSDAGVQPTGRVVSFERLLINTPNFNSRYQGEFKGVIIAEMALGSLGDFSFKFDDIFSRVFVLPLLNNNEILRVTP